MEMDFQPIHIKRHLNMMLMVPFLFSMIMPLTVMAGNEIEHRDIIAHCVLNGCDNPLFYRYYDQHHLRFCGERKLILKNTQIRKTFSYVATTVRNAGLNMSVSALPIMESSLDPHSKGSDHPNAAVGLWQFKPSTARDMGLIVSEDVDDRFDMEKSTTAAIKYIKWLEERYDGDHNLAILAYHVGTGRINRHIEKFGTDNPWFLSQLISEKNPDKNYLLKYHSYTLSLMGKKCS